MAKLRDIINPESLSALRQAKLALQLIADPEGIKYALDEYRKDKLGQKPRPLLARKRVAGDAGGHYLVTNRGRAKFQTDDPVEAVLIAVGYGDQAEIHDMRDLSWMQRKYIAQYLATIERNPFDEPNPRVDGSAPTITDETPGLDGRMCLTVEMKQLPACSKKPPKAKEIKGRDCTPELVKILKQLGIIEPAKLEVCPICQSEIRPLTRPGQDPCDCARRERVRAALEREHEKKYTYDPSDVDLNGVSTKSRESKWTADEWSYLMRRGLKLTAQCPCCKLLDCNGKLKGVRV